MNKLRLVVLVVALCFNHISCQILNLQSTFTIDSVSLGDTVEFTVNSLDPSNGYVAFGFGNSMSRAEIYICWANSGEVTVSRRYSASESLPIYRAAYQSHKVDFSKSKVNADGTFTAVFTRATLAASVPLHGYEVDITPKMDLIWSVSQVPVPSSDPGYSGLVQHSLRADHGISTEMFSNNTRVLSGGSAGTREGYLQIHGILMFVAWMIAAPTAIWIAKFGKTALGVWWFRLHILFAFFGTTVLTIVGYVMAKFLAGESYNTSMLRNVHAVFGVFLVGAVCFQSLLGIIIDRLFNVSRTSIPWYDKLHWWFGRFSTIVSWVNVPLGLTLWAGIYGLSLAIIVLTAVWLFWVLIVFIFSARRAKNKEMEKVSSEEH